MRVSIDKINGILVLYKIKKQRQSLIIQLPLFSVNITSLTINNSSKIENNGFDKVPQLIYVIFEP